MTSHRFILDRSVSPESVSRSVSPPRSRSNSPFKTMGEKSRSLTPDGMASGGRVTPEFRNFDRINITSNYRSLSGLERKLSNTTGDYHSTFNSHKRLTLDRSVEKMVSNIGTNNVTSRVFEK